MRLFYIEEVRHGQKRCIINGSEARHIYKVLRMGVGDSLLLMDKDGTRYKAVIESIRQGKVNVIIKEVLPPLAPSPVEILVCISMIRSDPLDLVIQKASELGASKVQPFYSERSIVKVPKERLQLRLRHWNEVAKNAAKQCGRSKPLEVLAPISLHELLSQDLDESLCLLLWEQESSVSIKEVLRKAKKRKIIGVIGPEGGFSKKEVDMLREKGFISVTMGARILRAETAAIVFVALAQYELGDLGLSYDTKSPFPMRP